MAATASSNLFRWKARGVSKVLLDPFLLLSLVALVLFAGTRVGIGRDYFLYSAIFARVDPSNAFDAISQSPQEVGFTVLSLLIKGFGGDQYAFFFIISALTIALIFVSIGISGVNPAPAILVYLLYSQYLSPMNIARQGLACAILFLAVTLFTHSKSSRAFSVLLGIIAISIHVSSILAIIFFIVARYVRITPLTSLMGAFLAWLFGASVTSIPFIRDILGLMNDRYVNYLDSAEAAGLGTYLVALIHLALGAFIYISHKWSYPQSWWLSMYLLTAPFYILGTTIGWAARLGEFFSIFLLLLTSELFEKRGIRATWPIFILGFGYFSLYLSFYAGLLPYASWFW